MTFLFAVVTNLLVVCTNCLGVGSVSLPCPSCGGAGRVEVLSRRNGMVYTSFRPCASCSRGLVNPRTVGAGRVSRQCPVCRGRKRVRRVAPAGNK